MSTNRTLLSPFKCYRVYFAGHGSCDTRWKRRHRAPKQLGRLLSQSRLPISSCESSSFKLRESYRLLSKKEEIRSIDSTFSVDFSSVKKVEIYCFLKPLSGFPESRLFPKLFRNSQADFDLIRLFPTYFGLDLFLLFLL